MTKNDAINDNEWYIFKMEKSFEDKAWFTSIMPKDVDTIIDFWCANWAFISYLQKDFPNYNYIWIDNNYSFFHEAQDKWFQIFWTITDLVENKNIGNIQYKSNSTLLLLLNSVLHEVYSYTDPLKFRDEVQLLNPKYIAIRDMCAWWETDTEKMFNIIQKDIKGNAIKEKNYSEFVKYRWSIKDRNTLIHYLLKKDYRDNRNREVAENYLPLSKNWYEDILKINWYNIKISNPYLLEFLKNKWIHDFNWQNDKEIEQLIAGLSTHIKIFAEKIW